MNFENLQNLIDRLFIEKYIKTVSQKYGLKIDEIAEIWRDVSERREPLDVVPVKKSSLARRKKVQSSARVEPVDNEDDKQIDNRLDNSVYTAKKCKYTFSRPPRVGMCCDAPTSSESGFCGKHKKYENRPAKIREALPKQMAKDVVVPQPFKRRIYLYIHTILNLPWHPPTGAVFKSREEKKVLGFVKNKADADIQPISAEYLKICHENGFETV
jgi:hypothetical protein